MVGERQIGVLGEISELSGDLQRMANKLEKIFEEGLLEDPLAYLVARKKFEKQGLGEVFDDAMKLTEVTERAPWEDPEEPEAKAILDRHPEVNRLALECAWRYITSGEDSRKKTLELLKKFLSVEEGAIK